MKKVLCAILALALLVCFSACQTDAPSAENPTPQEPLTDRYLREIQDTYDAQMAKEENQSTAQMVQITQQYTQTWSDVAQEYYEKLMGFSGELSSRETLQSVEDLRAYVETQKQTFDADYLSKSDAYLQSLQESYGGGSIIGLSMSVFQYDLQKNWALSLLQLYDTYCQ